MCEEKQKYVSVVCVHTQLLLLLLLLLAAAAAFATLSRAHFGQ